MNKTKAREQYDFLIFAGNYIFKIKDQFSREMIHLAFRFLLSRSHKLLRRRNGLHRRTNDSDFQKGLRREKFLHKQLKSIEATADILCIPNMRTVLLKQMPKLELGKKRDF